MQMGLIQKAVDSFDGSFETILPLAKFFMKVFGWWTACKCCIVYGYFSTQTRYNPCVRWVKHRYLTTVIDAFFPEYWGGGLVLFAERKDQK